MTIVLGKVNLLLSHPSSHANPHAIGFLRLLLFQQQNAIQ